MVIEGDQRERYKSAIPSLTFWQTLSKLNFRIWKKGAQCLRIPRLAPSLFMSATYGPPEPLSIYNRNLFARRVRQLEERLVFSRLLPRFSRNRGNCAETARKPWIHECAWGKEMERKVEEEAHVGGQIDCSFIPHRLKDELQISLEGSRFVTCDRILSYPRALISFASWVHSFPVVNAASSNMRFKSLCLPFWPDAMKKENGLYNILRSSIRVFACIRPQIL